MMIDFLTAPIDAQSVILLLVFTSLIAFWMGVVTPFLVVRLLQSLNFKFDEFIEEDESKSL